MIEPTKRDEEVYALLLSNRGRVTDLAAYREELLAASAQSAERCVKCEYKARAERAEIAQVESLMNTPAQSAEPQEAEAQRHEIRFIDATPDEGYIRRILEAYIDDSYYSDNTAGLPPENKVYKMMNKWREERNALLRAALARLASKPSREEELRTVLAEIERYARASLCDHRGGSPDVGSCPNCKSYLHIIELARAALAQGGARDEAGVSK